VVSGGSHFSHVSDSTGAPGRRPFGKLRFQQWRLAWFAGGGSEDFRKQVLGYGLPTAQILDGMPDHVVAATYVWRITICFRTFSALKDFSRSGSKKARSPCFAVHRRAFQACSTRRMRAVDGVFRCNDRGFCRVGRAKGRANARPMINSRAHHGSTHRCRVRWARCA